MSTLRTTNVIHGSSAISNIVLDNQGRAIFGPDSPQGRAALYVNAQTNRVGINTELPAVALDVDGAINATGNVNFNGNLNLLGDFSVGTNPSLFVDTSNTTGRVGIGTNTPTNLLEVVNSVNTANTYIKVQNTGAGNAGVKMQNTDGEWTVVANDQLRIIDEDSSAERVTIDSSGRVGISRTNPDTLLDIGGNDLTVYNPLAIPYNSLCNVLIRNDDTTVLGTYAGLMFRVYGNSGNATRGSIGIVKTTTGGSNGALVVGMRGSAYGDIVERLRVTSDGNIGINTTNPSAYSNGYRTVTINGTGTRGSVIDFKTDDVRYGQISNTTTVFNMQSGEDVPITFSTGGSQALRMLSNGSVLCGPLTNALTYPQPGSSTDYRTAAFQIQHRTGGTSDAGIILTFTNNQSEEKLMMGVLFNGVAQGPAIRATVESAGSNAYGMKFYTSPTYLSPQLERMNIGGNGTVTIPGSLTVSGTKNFNIKHPLASKKETHTLIHTCIEGPRADLIYRGKVQLVNGEASVNIDESATMTEGTFAVLARNVQCFTTNETDWCPVKGSVTKNILTITAKDVECSAVISWMVIGERKDQQIVDAVLTDENGHVIVELLNEDILKRGTVLAE
jgi:hypothetical protein